MILNTTAISSQYTYASIILANHGCLSRGS